MIGLFGIAQAPGPAVLMAICLVASILFHVSLNGAVGPLLNTLPKSLEVEEEHLLALENGTREVGKMDSADGKDGLVSTTSGSTSLPPPHKKPNILTKWLHPERYSDYQTLRRLVPRDFAEINYSPEVESSAYHNPAVKSPPPLLWIPRDSMGISRQEVAHTSKVISITDEGATFDDKGKIFWDTETNPPIYEEKIYY